MGFSHVLHSFQNTRRNGENIFFLSMQTSFQFKNISFKKTSQKSEEKSFQNILQNFIDESFFA